MTSLLPVGPADPTLVRPASAEPLPLPEPGWGAAAAVAGWREALPAMPPEVLAGLVDDHDVTVVSALTTVVLKAGPWAVKVYPVGTEAGHIAGVTEALHGSRWAHLSVAAPVETSLGVVTVARWLTPQRVPDWAEVGGLLRRFHVEHAHAALPAWQPLSRLDSQVAALPERAAEVLRGARDQLLAAVGETWSELGWGAVHGDLSLENVMVGDDGPVLIDLDWTVVAPRELDLAPVARRYASGEIDRATYLHFCRTYGHDVAGWPGLELLDRVAELGGLVFRIWDCRHHGRPLDWLDEALRRWHVPI